MLDNSDGNNLLKLYLEAQSETRDPYRDAIAYSSRKTIQCLWDEPWMLFVREIRNGGAKAAMELLMKKSDVLSGLNPNRNAARGIVFEELQIAKLMAEVRRRNLPIEFYAGDGRGVFLFQGERISTPMYTDAIFRDTKTNEFFAIQFKYSDDPKYLLEMIESWSRKHQGAAQDHLPEALRLANIQVVAPENVADGKLAKATMDIGLEMQTDSIEVIEKFLSDNEQLLKELLQDQKISSKLEQIKQKGKDAKINQRGAEARQKAIDSIKANKNIPPEAKTAKLAELKAQLEGFESNSKRLSQEQEALVNELKSLLTGKIKCKTAEQLKVIGKHFGAEVAAGAIADGLLTLVVSCDEEIRLYLKGEIAGADCARRIMKQTAIGIARGASLSGFLALPAALGEAFLATGYASVGRFLRGLSCYLGLCVTLGITFCSAISIYKSELPANEWRNSIVRSITAVLLNAVGTVGTCALSAAPAGLAALAVVTGISIMVGTGDHFFGERLCKLIFGDEEELKKAVLKESYKVLDCAENCSNDELKTAVEAKKAEVLKSEKAKEENKEKNLVMIDSAYDYITKLKSDSA